MVRRATLIASAAAVALLFAALTAGLIGLGEIDWKACADNSFNQAFGLTERTERVADMGTGIWLAALWQKAVPEGLTQWPLFTHPRFALFEAGILFLPPFALALPATLSRRPLRRRAFALTTLALFGLVFVLLLPAASQHDCDRKGNVAVFGLWLLPVAALVLATIAKVISRLRP